jgi:uncharacterized protein (DUF2236 family)
VPEPVLPEPSVARRLNRELFLLLGGTAALLMQVSHPLVAAGVQQHSDFQRDPIGRLRRTLNTTLAVVFAEPGDARAALRRIDRRHGPVRGIAADGRAYDARDPGLLLWVQATLVLTSLRLYERVAGRLPIADREAYWQETRPIAAALGIPIELLPKTIGDLERYEEAMLATAVVPDTTSLDVARQVLRPFGWVPAPVYWPSDAIAAALIPSRLRRALGLRYRTRERVYFALVIAATRIMRTALPPWLTIVPQARRFEARHAP